ncbi:MAG: winged helix-turn-helix domain-containing protein [Acidobacteriota bacterium]
MNRSEGTQQYRFQDFQLDPTERLLRRKGQEIPLTPTLYDLLLVLVKNSGHLLDKEQLMEAVWAGRFVEEGNLTRSISSLRSVLGDDASHPRLIETIPRRGYRFVAEVTTTPSQQVLRIPIPLPPATEDIPETRVIAPSDRRPRRWKVWVISAGLVITAALVVWVASRLLRPDQRSSQAGQVVPLTSFLGPEWSTSWSPDGRFIAMSRWYQGNNDVFIQPRSGGDPVQLTDSPADDWCARWSPDGRWLAYLSNEGAGENVYLISPAGGLRKKLTETYISYLGPFEDSYMVLGNNPWSPDSRELLFSRLGENERIALWKIRLEDLQETQIMAPPPGHDDLQGAWSYDGRSIVFLRRQAGKCGLWLLSEAGGKPQPLLADGFDHTHPVWLPDNQRIVFESNRAGAINLWEITIPSRRLRQLTTGVGAERRPIVSSQGELAYTHHRQQTDLYLRDLAKGNETRLTLDTRRNYQPRLSPDGMKMAFQSNRAGSFDIWVLDLATREQRQVTNHPADDHSPDWSPDGSQIVFFSDRDEGKLWVVGVSGGPARPLTDLVAPSRQRGAGVIGGPKWSPDGKLIGCVAPGKQGSTLWLIDVETLDVKPAVSGVADFGWYRDCRHVIYTPSARQDEAVSLIKVVNLQTGKSRILLDQVHRELAVAPGGLGVTFVAGLSHQELQLWLLRLHEPRNESELPAPAGIPEQLTHGDTWHVHNGGWSWDGQSVVYMRDTVQADIYLLEGYR